MNSLPVTYDGVYILGYEHGKQKAAKTLSSQFKM